MSERVADLLFQNLVLGSDAVLSMHCWSQEATVIPYVEYSASRDQAATKGLAIARALGVEFLHPYTWHPGLLVASATRHDIPSVEVEVGGMGTVTPAGVSTYREIIYRFLDHLKLLNSADDQVGPPHSPSKIINSHSDVPLQPLRTLPQSSGAGRCRQEGRSSGNNA